MKEMSEVKVDGPVVIAMKGHPCTGKTTLAEKLAKSLKYPIIAQDDAWDSIVKKELENPMLLTSTTTPTDLINDLSFAVICQIASMELIFGTKLIIDSSLQCQAHVDRLIQMSKDTKARLVIVECKPRDRYEWQQRFKRRCESQGTCRFKPSTWEDIARGMEINGECSNVEGVSKLVVNTTEYVKNRNLADVVKHLVTLQDSLTIDFHEFCWGGNSEKEEDEKKGEESIDWVVDTEEIHDHQLTLYTVEQNIDEGEEEEEEEEEKKEKEKDAGDDNDSENDGDDGDYNDEQEEVICQGCLQPISDPVYYECEGCYIYAHKSCAELPNKKELMPSLYPPLLQDLPDQYSFPEIHRCRDCESNSIDDPDCETNNGDDPDGDESNGSDDPDGETNSGDDPDGDESNGSDDPDGETNSGDDESNGPCNQCLFETNLRCGVLPSIVLHDRHQHPLHQHPLRIQLNPFRSNHRFDCKVCGDSGEHASYSCSDCGTNAFECHLSCALLPRTYKLSCHRHPLKLISHIEHNDDDDDDDPDDELYCDVCEETWNPNHWLYYCAECQFKCHLKCMISKFEA